MFLFLLPHNKSDPGKWISSDIILLVWYWDILLSWDTLEFSLRDKNAPLIHLLLIFNGPELLINIGSKFSFIIYLLLFAIKDGTKTTLNNQITSWNANRKCKSTITKCKGSLVPQAHSVEISTTLWERYSAKLVALPRTNQTKQKLLKSSTVKVLFSTEYIL